MPASTSDPAGVLVVSPLDDFAERMLRVLAGRAPVRHLRTCSEACEFLASHPGQGIVISSFQAWKPESYARLIGEFARVLRIDINPRRREWESELAQPPNGQGHFAVLAPTSTDLEILRTVEKARSSLLPADNAVNANPIRMGRPDGQSAPAPLPEDLLLMVAHNVRSMAATIHGFAGLPARGIAAGALSAESILSRVHSVSGRLIAMVDDLTHALLLGSGLDHGKGDRVTPSEVVEAAYLDVNGSAEARQQQIDRRIQTSGSVRLVNRPCLQMALRNLLDNAIKYSPIGGGIVLEVFETGDWLTFRVSDSGPGIPPDRLRTLFSRPGSFDFSRVQQGMGLGLWITKRVAEWHGGDVHAESNPGGGATLVLRVRAPFADPGATPAVQPPPA